MGNNQHFLLKKEEEVSSCYVTNNLAVFVVDAVVHQWTMAHFLAIFELITSQSSYSSKKEILESYLAVTVSGARCDLCLT